MQAQVTGICSAVETYFQGLHRGDTALIRSVFDPEAQVVGYYHGSLYRQSMDEWMLELQDLPKPNDQGEAFDMTMQNIELSDSVAVVRTSVLYMGLRFTDLLTLVNVDGWKITHKAYCHK